MNVLNEYPGRHHYMETYVNNIKLYCPNCGHQGLVWESLSGDYYVGPQYICVDCSNAFYLPSGPSKLKDPNELKKVEQLRSGITHEPTTKRGL